MTYEELDLMFPPGYGGNAQISDLRLALTSLVEGELLGTDKSTGLERITHGNNTGWRLKGKNPDKYINIGEGAVDFTSQTYIGDYGVGGEDSVGFGYRNNISSDSESCFIAGSTSQIDDSSYGSTLIGENGYMTDANTCMAVGYYSETYNCYSCFNQGSTMEWSEYCSSFGDYNIFDTAENSSAFGAVNNLIGTTYTSAFGYRNKSKYVDYGFISGERNEINQSASSSVDKITNVCIIGKENIVDKSNTIVFGMWNQPQIDTLLEFGSGVSGSVRENAFELYKDGTGSLPKSTISNIQTRGDKALVTIEYLFSAEFGNSLPIIDPLVQGALWNNNSILTISAG